MPKGSVIRHGTVTSAAPNAPLNNVRLLHKVPASVGLGRRAKLNWVRRALGKFEIRQPPCLPVECQRAGTAHSRAQGRDHGVGERSLSTLQGNRRGENLLLVLHDEHIGLQHAFDGACDFTGCQPVGTLECGVRLPTSQKSGGRRLERKLRKWGNRSLRQSLHHKERTSVRHRRWQARRLNPCRTAH
jgi:hypothetical protein